MDNIEVQSSKEVENLESNDIPKNENNNLVGMKVKSSRVPLFISILALLVSAFALTVLLCPKCSKNNNDCSVSKNSGKHINDSTRVSGTSDVAYINTEKLLLEYKYSIKLNEDLLTEQAKARASVESKYKQFEKRYNDYMEKARLGSFISQSSMESQQNELMQEEAKLKQLEADLTQQLMEKQANLNKELLDTLTNFLNEYNINSKYSFILNSAVILNGEGAEDVTQEIIDSLNARYTKTIE